MLLFLLLHKVDVSTFKPSSFYTKNKDIYYEYQSAGKIQEGENPYNEILDSNMVENEKYTTLFPLYYHFLAVIRQYSENNFTAFLANFRQILLWSQFAGGVFIYLLFRRKNKKLVGYAAASFYMFNLWTLESFISLKQDLIAIAFLLASFFIFSRESNKQKWLAYLLFGISLGIKHIGIFVLPLYLMPLFFKERKPKDFMVDMVFLSIPIVIPALPFLASNFESFFNSMLFSFTRTPKQGDLLFGYGELLVNYSDSGINGTTIDYLLPRLPLLLATTLNILLLATKKIPGSFYLLSSISVFAVFNPVIFPQYITWIPPLLFVGLCDYINGNKGKPEGLPAGAPPQVPKVIT